MPNQWTCIVIISKGYMKVTISHKPETVWISKMMPVLAHGIIQKQQEHNCIKLLSI